MTPEKPPGLPVELWERLLAHQQAEDEFKGRKYRFMLSLKSGDDKIMDRALAQLTADERALELERTQLSQELRARFGMDL